MSLLGLNTATNLSLYAIPAAWVLAIAPHAYAMNLFNKERAPGTDEYDTTLPGSNTSRVKEAKLSPNDAGKFLRAEAAQANGFVNLPFFGLAILAGNVAHLPISTLNTYAGLYLLSRAIYTLIFINNTNTTLANARTASYLSGIGLCVTLIIKAGNKLGNGYVGL